MKESTWTKKLCNEMEKYRKAIVVPYVGSSKQVSGVPDRYILSHLWSGWIEFKNERTPISPLQRRMHREFNSRQIGSAFIARRTASTKVGDLSGVLYVPETMRYVTSLDAPPAVCCYFSDGVELLERIAEYAASLKRES